MAHLTTNAAHATAIGHGRISGVMTFPLLFFDEIVPLATSREAVDRQVSVTPALLKGQTQENNVLTVCVQGRQD